MNVTQEATVKVFSCYKDLPKNLKPIVLTIGNFDAVHVGHCALLQNAKKNAEDLGGDLCVLTFTLHPAEVLRPEISLPKLCTQKQKLRLFDKQNVDIVIFFEFTLEFSKQTAAEFLNSLHTYIPFDSLVLGHDALLGKDRLGDSVEMHQIAAQLGFKLNYITPYQVDGKIVSSSAIRRAIQIGDLGSAATMLGRRFSIYSTVAESEDHTMTLESISSLCLPPEGKYPVIVISEDGPEERPAMANVKKEYPFLTLNFVERQLLCSGESVEVIFC